MARPLAHDHPVSAVLDLVNPLGTDERLFYASRDARFDSAGREVRRERWKAGSRMASFLLDACHLLFSTFFDPYQCRMAFRGPNQLVEFCLNGSGVPEPRAEFRNQTHQIQLDQLCHLSIR
jgi:hypothetical protein